MEFLIMRQLSECFDLGGLTIAAWPLLFQFRMDSGKAEVSEIHFEISGTFSPHSVLYCETFSVYNSNRHNPRQGTNEEL